MNPNVSLCSHLAAGSAGEPAFAIVPAEIFGWHDGPLEAIVRCRQCSSLGWIELVDWSVDRTLRVYALAGLREADVWVYLRNARSASCDVKRHHAELQALAAAAGPFERLFAWSLPDERIVAAAVYPPDLPMPTGGWIDRLPRSEDRTWFAYLGLDKAGRS